MEASSFFDFLEKSPTSFHATKEMEKALVTNHFTSLNLKEPWSLKPGHKYVVREQGCLAAFITPLQTMTRCSIVAAHTDSPCLKLKPSPEVYKNSLLFLGVEVYGGPILPTWCDRDLVIAGKIVSLSADDRLREQLVFLSKYPCIIPLIAPHLEREKYKNGMELHTQEHLLPFAGLAQTTYTPSYVSHLISDQLQGDQLVDYDLFLVPLEPPRLLGYHGECVASYRLDNLASSYATLQAIQNIKNPSSSSLICGLFFDYEEIGSHMPTGAKSPFFSDILTKIGGAVQSAAELVSIRRNSLCISADMAHAFHPQYPHKYDSNHLPLLGQGIVIKYHSQKSYATSAKGGAIIKRLASRLGLSCQLFAARNDIPSGSTVGPIIASQLGIETVDIGIAQLTMHGTREIIATHDMADMERLLHHFFLEDLSKYDFF